MNQRSKSIKFSTVEHSYNIMITNDNENYIQIYQRKKSLKCTLN